MDERDMEEMESVDALIYRVIGCCIDVQNHTQEQQEAV